HISGNYPGDHRQNLGCNRCHTSNSESVPWPFAAYAPDCAGCHANEYRTGPHDKYGDVKYNVSELRDCAGACHEYTDSSMTTIRRRRSGEHRVSDGEF
ncbi:MAG: hypothetical protein KZQ87_19035, partial [Candidatus Thiodiazotropha sp. (ex Cardiolucina cf. quadrata)]|nr:hypothetical protein [Candidatus Thiodiazotropha sp. (ex Cardiolucina cf. quadrata)]